MLHNLKQFFDRHILTDGREPHENAEHALQVATAALLFEVMRMNGEMKEVERDVTIAIYAEGCKKPCATGCSGGCGCAYVCDACTKCEPAYKTVRIKQCICVDAAVPKEIEEVVCTTRIVEKKIQVKKCITEQVQVPVTRCVRECVKVPYTVTVKVPVCCAPCCN